MKELEPTPAFKTLWQSEAIYLDGMRHALGDEYLSSLVKIKGIYDTRTRVVAIPYQLDKGFRCRDDSTTSAT
jgi:hypothetical protein